MNNSLANDTHPRLLKTSYIIIHRTNPFKHNFNKKMIFKIPSLLLILLSNANANNDEGIVLVGNTITRTDVTDLADITRDIHDMESACMASNNTSAARKIYQEGRYAAHSLHYLATQEEHLNNDMTFGFQMYGLAGGNVEDGVTDKYKLFASEYVEKLFDEDKCLPAVRAAQHIVLWMQVSFELWNTVRSCAIAADPTYDNEIAGVDNLPKKADQIVAYWVGSMQDASGGGLDGDEGFSLYSATNEIADKFDTDELGGARANKNILASYEAISSILSSKNACTEYSKTIKAMWPILSALSRQILVPQIQSLILAMLEEDHDSIGIFATIVVPQMSQCRHSSYKYLKHTFLDNPYDSTKFHKTLWVLRDMYPCLGIACREVGHPIDYHDSALACPSYYIMDPILAGYPTSSEVLEESKIDLDMHQINILTQFDDEAYWKMARYIYKNGRNSKTFDELQDDDDITNDSLLSLHSLAVSGDRENAMYYNDFITYFDDPNYADTLILDAFDNKERWNDSSLRQRAAVIRITMQVHLMYMTILTKLNKAVTTCGADSDTDSSRINLLANNNFKDADDLYNRYYLKRVLSAWDEAAAFIVGSLEGEDIGGSIDFEDGASLWSLANNRCIEFDRQNDKRFAVSNSALFSLLLAGKGMIESRSCGHLERFATDIADMLLVPIMQSVIKYALHNQVETRGSTDVDVAIGESFATSLIPIILHYEKGSGLILMNNMVPVDMSQDLVIDGPQTVADTFLAVADFDCELIGKSFEVDACLHYQSPIPDTSEASRGTSVLSPFYAILGGVATTMYYFL